MMAVYNDAYLLVTMCHDVAIDACLDTGQVMLR